MDPAVNTTDNIVSSFETEIPVRRNNNNINKFKLLRMKGMNPFCLGVKSDRFAARLVPIAQSELRIIFFYKITPEFKVYKYIRLP